MRTSLKSLVFLTLAGGCANSLSAQQPRPVTPSDARADRIARAIDLLAREAVDAGIVPGIGVAVAMSGRTIYARSHGMADVTARIPATDATLWYLASTSKSFTGFGIALLADRGVLSFNDPISVLLPRMKWHASVKPDSLTLARFLSHTHGIDDRALQTSASYTGAIPESQWPSLVSLGASVGAKDLEYSNFGYNIAAMVIDAVRPEGWRSFLEQQVYRPAGMRHTYARVSGLGTQQIARPHMLMADGSYRTDTFWKTDATMSAAGGHVSTVGDLARWIIVQMDSGVIDDKVVFPKSAVVRSQTLIAQHTRETAKRFGSFDRTGWGAGWDLGSYHGERMVSRFGTYHTMRSHLSFLPGRRVGVVSVASAGLGLALSDVIATYAYDMALGVADADTRMRSRMTELRARIDTSRQRRAADLQQRNVRRAFSTPKALAKYLGTYAATGYGRLVLANTAGRPTYRWGTLHGDLEAHDVAKHQLRIDFVGDESILQFTLDARGIAASVQIEGVTLARVP